MMIMLDRCIWFPITFKCSMKIIMKKVREVLVNVGLDWIGLKCVRSILKIIVRCWFVRTLSRDISDTLIETCPTRDKVKCMHGRLYGLNTSLRVRWLRLMKLIGRKKDSIPLSKKCIFEVDRQKEKDGKTKEFLWRDINVNYVEYNHWREEMAVNVEYPGMSKKVNGLNEMHI